MSEEEGGSVSDFTLRLKDMPDDGRGSIEVVAPDLKLRRLERRVAELERWARGVGGIHLRSLCAVCGYPLQTGARCVECEQEGRA